MRRNHQKIKHVIPATSARTPLADLAPFCKTPPPKSSALETARCSPGSILLVAASPRQPSRCCSVQSPAAPSSKRTRGVSTTTATNAPSTSNIASSATSRSSRIPSDSQDSILSPATFWFRACHRLSWSDRKLYGCVRRHRTIGRDSPLNFEPTIQNHRPDIQGIAYSSQISSVEDGQHL